MLAELLNAASASFSHQIIEAPLTTNHKSGISLNDDESNFHEAMDKMGRQLTEVSKLDCYSLNSLGLQYKQGDLVCDGQ